MTVGMVGLVRGEMPSVDIAPVAVRAWTSGRAGLLEELHDARVSDRKPPRKLHRIALVVPSLRGDLVLVIRGDRWPILIDAAPHAVSEDLSRVGHVADDLERGPLVELRRAQAVGRHRANDPGDRRSIVGKPEGFVLVVEESFHVPLLSRMRESP